MKNKEYDVILLGAYTKDTIIKSNEKKCLDGGGFNYGTHVVAAMGMKVASITRLAKEDWYVVKDIKKTGADVYAAISEHSTCMVIEYPTDNIDNRNLYVTTTAGSFTKEQVEGFKAKAFVISPSIRGEVPIEVIDEIKKINEFISIDLQGFVRIIGNEGALVHAEWPEKEEILSRANVIKADAVEAEFITKEHDIYKAAQIITSYGPQEVVLTHKDGLLVYDGKNYYEAEFYPKKLVGRSGRGDTVISSYMAKRINASPEEATIWAAAVASIKMEDEGPFKRDIKDVEELILRKYK